MKSWHYNLIVGRRTIQFAHDWPVYFSERNGYACVLRVGRWSVRLITRAS